MLKLLGAVLILGSCTSLGLASRQALRRRVKAADAMLLALSLMQSEIGQSRTAMPELIGQLADNENEMIHTFFTVLQRRFREEQGLSLGYLWRSTLRQVRLGIGLGEEECDTLCDAANFLGRYDAEEQLTGLKGIARRLQKQHDAAQEMFVNQGNLYRTCGIALGILVVLILI